MGINKIDAGVVYTLSAPEQSLGVMPMGAEWRKLDLNSYSDARSQYDAAAREVMDGDRQLRKGTQSNKTVTFGYNNDVTRTNVASQIASFLYGSPLEKATSKSLVAGSPLTTKPTSAISGVTAASVSFNSEPSGFAAGDLVVILDGTNDRTLLTVSAVNGVEITFSPNDAQASVIPQTTGLANARLVKVGRKFAAGALSLTLEGSHAKLTSTDAAFAELTEGEWVFVGGDASDAKFASTPPFYARIHSKTDTVLTFDTTTSPIVNDAGAGASICVFYGTFIKNGKQRSSYTHVRYLGNDGDGNELSEVFTGCMPSELGINLGESSFVNLDMTYLGLDHRPRKQDKGEFDSIYNNVVEVTEEDAYHTSSGMYRQRLAVHGLALNPAALTSFVQDGSISVTNNLSADTANGKLGAFDHSLGDFGVSGEVTAYFIGIEALEAIRCNCSVGMDVILASKNSGHVIDMPSFTIGGSVEAEANASIKISLEQAAFRDSHYRFTLSWTLFTYLPDSAMPEGQSDCDC